VPMEVSAAYNGAEDGWSFRGGLANDGKINLTAIIERYLPLSYRDFIPDVVITQLEAGFETGASQSYDFSIGADWTISLLNTKISALVTVASLLENGRRVYDGEVQGLFRFGGHNDEGGLELKITAKFNDASQVYIFEFLGWNATLSSTATDKTLTFQAVNKSLGEMIEVLINAIFPGADISLAPPWSVLNSVSLGSFKFVVKFSPVDSSPQTAGLTYSPKINLGFARLDDIALDYEVETGKVMFRIVKGSFLGKEIGPQNPVEWNVAEPETTPAVPGQGSELFRLDFLGVGQHMAVLDKASGQLAPVPASVFGAIAQLTDAFKGEENLTLVFNEASGWLIGTRFTVIQAVDLGGVFYDPELFGLVISVTGSKAKEKLPIFDGLVFEILYKKINDTIGMWQIDLTLPYYIRNLEFGAVSVTLPSMKLQIYTNGDFLVDFGFPANNDFSRSFAIQAFPFVGSGGVYFGMLSSATTNRVPVVTDGNFSPVIAFGLGLRIGLGKDLKYGPLKAGLSVTIQGVLEGVFAWYNRYPTALAAGSSVAAGSDAFYYMIQARVSLVGRIYGTVDLKIITADLDVEVVVSIRLTLEAYRAIQIYFTARISLTLRVKVNLGLFKITIRLSYSTSLSFSFTIGSNQVAPWGHSALFRQAAFVRALDASADEECPVIPVMKWQPLLNADRVKVPVMFVPQFTAGTDGPLGVGNPRKPYVVAMTYVSSQPSKAPAPLPAFDEIARGALLWTLNAYLNSDTDHTRLEELLQQDISIEQLNEIYCYLTQADLVEPFTEDEVMDFLENFFVFRVTLPDVTEDQDVSVFPIMPLLRLTTSTGINVDFLTQTPASEEYLASIKAYFEQLAVKYKSPAEKAANPQTLSDSPEPREKSLASFIFLDFFTMLARSTIQDAISALQTQEAALDTNESLASFVQRRPDLAIDVVSLAMANVTRPLRAGVQVRVPGVVYTIKLGDTLQTIAARFNVDILELRFANPLLDDLTPASELRLPTLAFTTSETKPESLLDLSRFYGVSIASLAQANQDVAELFPAGERLLAPFAQQEKIYKLVFRLEENQSFNNLSGLAARVLLQGLRPPSPEDGPRAGETAPLYELTGQQFDGSDLVAGSTITLTVPDEATSWFNLGDSGDSLTYTITQSNADTLTALQNAPFGPVAKFEAAELLRIEPRRFTLATSTLWHTPTINRESQSLTEPYLWAFPSELMEVITGPQALQPKVQLWTQRQESPGQEYPRELVRNYLWATTIEIQARQTPSGDNFFLPNTYEMTGIDPGGSRLLENLLVWYAGADKPSIYGLHILYPPNPAVPGQEEPPKGLQSDPRPTFFLLQTNLSTASRPPQVNAAIATRLAAAPEHDPLGQTDVEFLKLLWESSIVNSGGYVLYYKTQSGQGLPGYLFSQEGVGKLTLLITYSIAGNVLENYLNTAVIYQPIDIENEVLYLAPAPQTVSNFRLSPDESLADVSKHYRVTVSQLATQYNNANAQLTVGKHVRIPPGTIWRVQLGDTLASLAERFSVSVVALAHANKNVPGLIEESIQFDDRLEEAIVTIPPGNVAFKFRRPPAVSNSPVIDPRMQLEELYNLLGYRIKESNGFEATNSALPISPETEKTDEWIYESVVPVSPFFKANPGTPEPRLDPYNGIGNRVELNLNWQDLFGNWIDSDMNNQSWPTQGFPVGYIDDLIALDEWPSVTSDYVIAPGEQGSPELTVTLRFNAGVYVTSEDPEAGRDMALTDLGKFQLIYYQLTQPDVNVTFGSTMQAPSSASASPRDVMVQFVLSIINFLTPISLGQPAPPPPAAVGISQPVADGNPQNLFALVVRVEITRNPDLVNDEFKDIPSVSTVSSRVPANAGSDNPTLTEPVPPLSLQEFARQLETAFPQLKMLVAAPKKALGQTGEEIWIARLAPVETGIAFNINGQQPSFFAVAPLARTLLSRPDVAVYPYHSGRFIGNEIPVKTSQNSVDLEQLGRDFLTAVEEVLGPQFTTETWKIEHANGTRTPSEPPDPQKNPYEAIIWAKELLATAISRHLVNVFAEIDPNASVEAAREQLRQQLLIKLTTAYTIDILLQYPVAITHSQYAGDDPFAPQMFGKPVAENPEDPTDITKKDAFAFSTGKFSLAKRQTGTHLTFSFDTNREQQGKDGTQLEDVFVIDLYHRINALEHEIHPVPGIEGYLASSWLTFVLPESPSLLVPLGEQTIPVPLRAYPTPPSLSEQTFIPLAKQFVGDGEQLSAGEDLLLKARLWKYRCQYEYVGAAHDKILASIKLDVPASNPFQAQFSDLDNPDLFAALVQFTAVYPEIGKDLDQHLATGGDRFLAENAIASFAWLAQRAANAWLAWKNDLYTSALPDSPEYHFVIEQRSHDIGSVNALIVVVTVDGLLRLPELPVVEIAGYKTEVLANTSESASYYFVNDEQVLSYTDGRNLSSRGLLFNDFDILKVENAWAGAAVKRNENLAPDKTTNPDFVLQSPVVRFVNVLTPLLDPDVEINIADYTAQQPSSLNVVLSNFLIAFFEGAQTVVSEKRTIRMSASYGYELQPGAADLSVTIPILLMTPASISILPENLSPTSAFVRSIADTVNAWFLNNTPSGIQDSGRLWFDLSIYSSLSESQLPVLRMRRLFLETKLLKI
jgi:LysM repeat protein